MNTFDTLGHQLDYLFIYWASQCDVACSRRKETWKKIEDVGATSTNNSKSKSYVFFLVLPLLYIFSALCATIKS